MPQPIASLSLDLDNKWSYLKTRGDPRWEGNPSYLDVVGPRFLEMFKSLDLAVTVFVVGQDAALEENHDAIASIAAAGHEIGNHSFHHEPWLHLYSEQQIEDELAAAEEHLVRVTGQRPVGFRGPGYSLSRATLEELARRRYLYDASTLPTFLGPLARTYYFLTSSLDKQQKRERESLFGGFREGLRPLRPYVWRLEEGRILEIPVTTMPLFRVPIHVSYLLYLSQYSKHLALTYFRLAISLCRMTAIAPSLLLHPLDFLGCDDDTDLAFFPAMSTESRVKLLLVREVIGHFASCYHVVSMKEHATRVGTQLAQLELPLEDRGCCCTASGDTRRTRSESVGDSDGNHRSS